MEVCVKDIVKNFKGIECISNVSFNGYANEIIGVLAPRRSGKTLLLNLLRGQTQPDKGSITYTVDGNKIESKKNRKYVGYFDTDSAMYEYMTVSDYLNFVAGFYKLPQYLRKERIRNLLKICGLASRKHKLISELSKGAKQRMGIAQALVHNPPFLLLDEPVKGLDPVQSQQIYELIKEQGKERTIILTSSRMQDMENMCDTMLVLSNGNVLAKGTVEELQQEVANSSILQLRIGGAEEHEVLQELQKINYIQVVGSRGLRFDIHTTQEEQFAQDLMLICSEKAWYIQRFVAAEKSLEDIFKQLRKN